MLNNYQVAYNTNGKAKLFEFYLFVNPLGRQCQLAESELNQTIARVDAKTDVHILCYTSQHLISRYMQQLGYHPHDLARRNEIFNKLYHATLAYKAACLQGKRRGRQFLISMQQRINPDLSNFDDDFILALANDLSLDMVAFNSDRQSSYVKNLYYQDQQIAFEMQVQQTPSLIIFEQCSGDTGILLQGTLCSQHILQQLDQLVAEGYQNRTPFLKVISS